MAIKLTVNNQPQELDVDPEMLALAAQVFAHVLRGARCSGHLSEHLIHGSLICFLALRCREDLTRVVVVRNSRLLPARHGARISRHKAIIRRRKLLKCRIVGLRVEHNLCLTEGQEARARDLPPGFDRQGGQFLRFRNGILDTCADVG